MEPSPDDLVTDLRVQRWPDIATVPAGAAARLQGRAAARLFRRAARRVGIWVEYPDGTVLGPVDGVPPRMILRRPDHFFARLGTSGLIGLGESYMAGDWSTDDLVALLVPFAKDADHLVPRPLHVFRRVTLPTQPDAEDNAVANTRANIARHYDLSNELFATFLDDTLTYSAALFEEDPDDSTRFSWASLKAAQHRKIDRLLDMAGVGPGTRLLEIGTGWGELCLRAAARGATVRSVTLSSEQQRLATGRIADAGLADRARVDLCDYRLVDGEYDAIVSVEMIEAVGRRYWPAYFTTIDRLLAPGGRVAIQAITMPHHRLLDSEGTQTWIHKYIFPGGQLTSLTGLDEVVARHTSLTRTSALSMGPHYAETLRLWRTRFGAREANVLDLGFDRTFLRMWEFYLAYSEAGFRSRYLDVLQLGWQR